MHLKPLLNDQNTRYLSCSFNFLPRTKKQKKTSQSCDAGCIFFGSFCKLIIEMILTNVTLYSFMRSIKYVKVIRVM